MWRDWKSILGVLLVFALGGLAGGFLSRSLDHHRLVVALERGSPAYEQFLERRLSHGLHLDPGQQAKFHAALVANIEKRKQLESQLQPQAQALNVATRHELRDILRPDQMVTLKQNMHEFRRRYGSSGLGEAPAPLDAGEAPPASQPSTGLSPD